MLWPTEITKKPTQKWCSLTGKPVQTNDEKHVGKALFEFGNEVLNDGEFFYAEKAFNLLIQQHPESIYADQALFGLARCYQLQENHSQALEAYEQLIQRNHRSYQAQEALFQIGDVKLYEQFQPARSAAGLFENFKFLSARRQARRSDFPYW